MNEKKEATLTKAKAELREKRKKLQEAQKTPEKSSSGKSKSSSRKKKRERLEKTSSDKSKPSSSKKEETLEKSSSGKDAKKPRSAKSKSGARKKEKDKAKGLKKSSSDKARKSKSEVKTIPSTDKDLKIPEKTLDNEKPEVPQKKEAEKKRSKDVKARKSKSEVKTIPSTDKDLKIPEKTLDNEKPEVPQKKEAEKKRSKDLIRTQSTNTIKKKSMDDISKKEDQNNKINCKCPEITGTERDTALCMSGEKKKEVQDAPVVKTERKKKKKTSNDLPNELDRRIYKTKCDEYKPQVYSFSAPSKTGIQTIQSPPFWLLVDHLIAVTWKLYFNEESEKKGLGITQLQWAYEFLMTMKHEDGELKEPMNSLAKLIEEALIALYSNLAQTARNEEKKEPILDTYKSTDTDDKKVSYTLDDILLRAPTMQNKEKEKEKPVKKPKLENNKKTLDKQDVLKYLQHIKKEQMEKANREKVHLEEIDEVIKLVQNDQFDETWKSKPGEKNS